MGAALSFYTAFSLAPLLILVITTCGLFFGRDTATREIIAQISQLIGHEGAESVQALLSATQRPVGGFFATTIGVGTLFIGATGALVELQDGLNRIWNAKEHGGFMTLLRQRLLSLALLIGIAFLLLVSLVFSAGISAVDTLLSGRYPISELFWHSTDILFSWLLITVLFAMIYKILPDTFIRWNDVWIGAAVASLLFTLGKFLVGLYIGKSAITLDYGTAASFVVVLIWVYYSTLLLYYGAEFTKVYADRFGSRA